MKSSRGAQFEHVLLLEDDVPPSFGSANVAALRSISRCHATIRYQKGLELRKRHGAGSFERKSGMSTAFSRSMGSGSFILEDHNSKFGAPLEVFIEF